MFEKVKRLSLLTQRFTQYRRHTSQRDDSSWKRQRRPHGLVDDNDDVRKTSGLRIAVVQCVRTRPTELAYYETAWHDKLAGGVVTFPWQL